jgi:hypothetical protein
MVCDVFLNQELDIEEKNEDISSLEMTTVITQVRYADLGGLIDQVFHDIKTTTIEIMVV